MYCTERRADSLHAQVTCKPRHRTGGGAADEAGAAAARAYAILSGIRLSTGWRTGGGASGNLHSLLRPNRSFGGPSRSVRLLAGIARASAALCAALALACVAQPAAAAQIRSVQVTRRGSQFTILMRLAFQAPPWAVFAALQDYAAMPRYNPDLRSVRIEPTGEPGRIRLLTIVHACVLIFCRTLHQEQIMTATADARGEVLRAALVPHGGSFRSGHASWTVRPCRTGGAPTCLDARIELQPAFWVPPLIGPWILRHKMYQEARRSGHGLERIAARLLASCAHAPRPRRCGAEGGCHLKGRAAARLRVSGSRPRCRSASRPRD